MTDVHLLLEERRDRLDVFTTWLPRIALAIVFVAAGRQKFETHSVFVRIFDQIGIGQWFRYATGLMQIVGAALLLIPRAGAVGFVLLGCTMAGAVAFWLFIGHQAFSALVPGALLAAIVVFGWTEMARAVGNLRRLSVSK